MKRFKADLHIHSCLSPCGDLDMSPRAIVRKSLEVGLDLIAVCDHNSAENVAAVIRAEPDWAALPDEAPAAIRKLLRRCLAKDLRQRPQPADPGRQAEGPAESEADHVGPGKEQRPSVRPLVDGRMIHLSRHQPSQLAHLVEMNHSAAFWRVVESACPDYKQCRAELRGYGVAE